MSWSDTFLFMSLLLAWAGGFLLFWYWTQKNPPRTWRGDPFKWLFVWGYREKYLREHGDQVDQVKNSAG